MENASLFSDMMLSRHTTSPLTFAEKWLLLKTAEPPRISDKSMPNGHIFIRKRGLRSRGDLILSSQVLRKELSCSAWLTTAMDREKMVRVCNSLCHELIKPNILLRAHTRERKREASSEYFDISPS